MKTLKFLLPVVFALFTTSIIAQEKTDTIKVYGECGMCKNRIQKALKMEGITAATWDSDTKLLAVTYNAAIISNDDIQKKVAAVGHDTDKFQTSDAVYAKLPGCCKYDRPAKKD